MPSTLPKYTLRYNTMTNNVELSPEQVEEKLQETNIMKGFRTLTVLSDLLGRHNFDLNAQRGGRIYYDEASQNKLRRKVDKENPDQNEVFESYATQDGQNVVKATLTLSEDGFTPSQAITATAAKIATDGDSAYTQSAAFLLRIAAALLAEHEKSKLNIQALTDASGLAKEDADEFYGTISNLQARAFSITAVGDYLTYLISNTKVSTSLESEMKFLQGVTDEKFGEGAKDEANNTFNLLTSSIANTVYSTGFNDLIIMGDEVKDNLTSAALVEVDGQEQK